MSDKEFGIKFTKTDNGFRIDVTGDEELVNAHREMADAWHDFVRKARKAAKVHHHHHHSWHQDCCCDDDEDAKDDKQD